MFSVENSHNKHQPCCRGKRNCLPRHWLATAMGSSARPIHHIRLRRSFIECNAKVLRPRAWLHGVTFEQQSLLRRTRPTHNINTTSQHRRPLILKLRGAMSNSNPNPNYDSLRQVVMDHNIAASACGLFQCHDVKNKLVWLRSLSRGT